MIRHCIWYTGIVVTAALVADLIAPAPHRVDPWASFALQAPVASPDHNWFWLGPLGHACAHAGSEHGCYFRMAVSSAGVHDLYPVDRA